MSDDAYALVMAITCLLYLAVLILRWRQGRIVRRLQRALEAAKAAQKNGDASSEKPDA
jgi:hypothetical protein